LPVIERFKKAWNAFRNVTPFDTFSTGDVAYYGGVSPSRPRHNVYSERSIVSSVYTRISVDVAGILIKHVKIDENGRYLNDVPSQLNECLKWQPNIDQSPRPFRQDIAMTLFDRGVAAIVPVDTTRNPQTNDIFDIYSLRVGEIVTWYPRHVRVSVYNEARGAREEITLEKRYIAIVENPLFAVMNEPNSTLQRLIRKLSLLDAVDEQSGSGKLDLIIQLPYVIKSEARRQQAEKRREDIEFQLKGSQYGIAYTDGTEKITQLNRPAENNLLKQVEYLTNMLYSQLGLTPEVMTGTATEETMINYFNRSIEPVIDAIIESMQRAFLGPQGSRGDERILYFRDPFKLVPVSDIAEIADKFTRNEILSANEIRHFLGIKPSDDPKADKLINSNMPQAEEAPPTQAEALSSFAPFEPTKGPNAFERNSQNGS
jgi:Phage portal protein